MVLTPVNQLGVRQDREGFFAEPVERLVHGSPSCSRVSRATKSSENQLLAIYLLVESADLFRTSRTTSVACKCLLHSLISETVELPTAATSRTQSICGRIAMTSSLDNMGGISRITVRALKSLFTPCRRLLIAREAINSDEPNIGASVGKTMNRWLSMR